MEGAIANVLKEAADKWVCIPVTGPEVATPVAQGLRDLGLPVYAEGSFVKGMGVQVWWDADCEVWRGLPEWVSSDFHAYIQMVMNADDCAEMLANAFERTRQREG